MLRRRIDVSEAVSSPRGQLVWSTPKSHASRSVPFPSFLAASIAQRCQGRNRDDLLFVGPDGGVLRAVGTSGAVSSLSLLRSVVGGTRSFLSSPFTTFGTRRRAWRSRPART